MSHPGDQRWKGKAKAETLGSQRHRGRSPPKWPLARSRISSGKDARQLRAPLTPGTEGGLLLFTLVMPTPTTNTRRRLGDFHSEGLMARQRGTERPPERRGTEAGAEALAGRIRQRRGGASAPAPAPVPERAPAQCQPGLASLPGVLRCFCNPRRPGQIHELSKRPSPLKEVTEGSLASAAHSPCTCI